MTRRGGEEETNLLFLSWRVTGWFRRRHWHEELRLLHLCLEQKVLLLQLRWCGALVPGSGLFCVRRGGLQGFKFPGMESFLGSKSDTVISCDTESSDL
jgi:hypothetical protein